MTTRERAGGEDPPTTSTPTTSTKRRWRDRTDGGVYAWTRDRVVRGRGGGADVTYRRSVYARGIAPNATTRVSDFPDVTPRKFTSNGELLLCVSRHQQELVGYRFHGLRECLRRSGKDGGIECEEKTRMAMGSFKAHFAEAWMTNLSVGDDAIVKDFMLEVHDGAFVVVVSATPLDGSSMAAGGAMREEEGGAGLSEARARRGRRETETQETAGGIVGAPAIQRITFHLVRTKTGEKVDSFEFRDDFMHLPRNGAVSLREDTLAVLSLKHQRVVFLKVHPEGRFEEVNRIGEHLDARDLDMIEAHRVQEEAWLEEHPEAADKIRRQSDARSVSGRPMLKGLTQRLVTFLYHDAKKSTSIDSMRLMHRNFERYVSLVMLRVRILDANLLLIKFGTPEYALARRGDKVIGPTMYGVFDMRRNAFIQTATSMGEMQPNGMVDQELNAPPRGDTLWARFAGSQGEALSQCNTCTDSIDENDEETRNYVASRLFHTQDYPPQFRSTSPYFDKRLFSYDERTITAIDRPQPHVDFGIKFVKACPGTRRRVSFKLMVNNSMANSSRSKRFVHYIFHPVYPFAMSISQAYMQPTLVNFHLRSAPGDELHEVSRTALM
jgi:de-etiolated-1